MKVIYDFLYSFLNTIFDFTGDWGVAIVVLTLIIRMMLLPVTLTQRVASAKQQVITRKIKIIKEKYQNEKDKMKAEIAQLNHASYKNMLGYLVVFIQMPILGALNKVFLRIPMQSSSVLIPWVASINIPDPYYIVPVLTMISQIAPNLLVSLGIFKTILIPKLTVQQIIISLLFMMLIFFKNSAALGLYWIISCSFSAFEQIGISMYKERSLAESINFIDCTKGESRLG